KARSCDLLGGAVLVARQRLDRRANLGDVERLSLDLVEADALQADLPAQVQAQLAGVQLGDEDAPVARGHGQEIVGQREDVAQMRGPRPGVPGSAQARASFSSRL